MGKNVHGISCSGTDGEIGTSVDPWAEKAKEGVKGNSAKQARQVG